jgi:hypothetical protein
MTTKRGRKRTSKKNSGKARGRVRRMMMGCGQEILRDKLNVLVPGQGLDGTKSLILTITAARKLARDLVRCWRPDGRVWLGKGLLLVGGEDDGNSPADIRKLLCFLDLKHLKSRVGMATNWEEDQEDQEDRGEE